ncbi:MAG: DNA primase [Candidatus Gracilibacteria bacterium]|nr:DNA primase [Candidatus Gracilibacteria bacterium]
MNISEELEQAIDIVDLVSKYASLKKAGANYKSVCPFPGHNEKTPSFMVSPSKQIAYCFGCHKGGGAIKFVMDIENCDFKNAIEILGGYTGIEVNTNFNKEKHETKKNIYSLYKDAVNYYKNSLDKYPEVKKYVFDRGLNEKVMQDFHFGYADSGVELYNYLKSKGYDDDMIVQSNIFIDIKTRKDKFINRLIFPIQNARGDFVAFTARIIGAGEPKYLNSPASDLYDKSNILYGLFNARTSISKLDFIIVTEGQMDTISLQAAGFTNTVAVSGSALTDKHLTLIKRLTHKVFLCFDGDSAGEKATKSALEKMKNNGFEVRIIYLPEGKDPDDVIKSGGNFQEYINKALTPIGYYIKKSNFDLTSIDEKKKLLLELLEIVKSYSDNIEKDYYLKEISKRLDINQNLIYDSFNRIKFTTNTSKDPKIEVSKTSSEDMVIGYCILEENNIEFFNKHILFKNGLAQDLKKVLEDGLSYINSLELNKKERYRGIALKIEAENEHANKEHSDEELQKIVSGLNREVYKKLVTTLKKEMANGNNEAFVKYTHLVNEAKKIGIK